MTTTKRNVWLSMILVLVFLVFSPSAYADDELLEERTMGLSLQSAVELGIARNLDVIIERYREEIAFQRIAEEESIFDPITGLSVEASRSEQPVAEVWYPRGYDIRKSAKSNLGVEGKIPTGAIYGVDLTFQRYETRSSAQTLRPQYSAKLNFSVTHPLLKDFGVGVTKTRIRMAETGDEIARYEVKDRVVRTVGAVEAFYWELAFALENLEVRRKSLELANKLLYETDIMVTAGEVPKLNSIQAKVGIAAREEEVILAENNARKADYDLKTLLDLPDDEVRITPLDRPQKDTVVPGLKESLDRAWKSRPDLQAVRLDVEQKEIERRYARNQVLPRLDVVAEYGYNGISGQPSKYGDPDGSTVDQTPYAGRTNSTDAFNDFFTKSGESWLLGMKFEAPWGNDEARSRFTQAELAKKRSRTEVRRLEEKIANEVKKAVLDILTAVKRMGTMKAGVGLAKEQLAGEVARFRAGEATSYNILEFEEELRDMKTKELMAIMDYNTAWSDLRVAEGVALDEYGLEFDPAE